MRPPWVGGRRTGSDARSGRAGWSIGPSGAGRGVRSPPAALLPAVVRKAGLNVDTLSAALKSPHDRAVAANGVQEAMKREAKAATGHFVAPPRRLYVTASGYPDTAIAAGAKDSVASIFPFDDDGAAMRICVVVGTRPEIVKMASVIHELRARRAGFVLVHTGQHYDANLSEVFFEELEPPRPDPWKRP